ncbi:MAG: four helix bundle protein [Patescibacteria group bacterium]|jgi:four helix bundle protein
MNNDGKINSFKDLFTWQEGHKLVLLIYEQTKHFPQDELFALTSQMRRAVVSITSNIAEGFSRIFPKEKTMFYSIAKGSLTELHNQLIIAHDLGYINEDGFKICEEQLVKTHKLLNGLVTGVRSLLQPVVTPNTKFNSPNSKV